MPTYSYQCQSCEHKFDIFQYMSEESLKNCPKCSKDELKRLIGPGAGFIFKGDGFYITDYRSKNYQEKAKSEIGSSTSSESSSSGKSESSTPAATPITSNNAKD